MTTTLMTVSQQSLTLAPVVNIIGSVLLIVFVGLLIFLGVRFYTPLMNWISKYSLIKLFHDLKEVIDSPDYQNALKELEGFWADYQSGKLTFEQFKQKVLNDGNILFILMRMVSVIATWARQFAKS